jgi:hypothetical protein
MVNFIMGIYLEKDNYYDNRNTSTSHSPVASINLTIHFSFFPVQYVKSETTRYTLFLTVHIGGFDGVFLVNIHVIKAPLFPPAKYFLK